MLRAKEKPQGEVSEDQDARRAEMLRPIGNGSLICSVLAHFKILSWRCSNDIRFRTLPKNGVTEERTCQTIERPFVNLEQKTGVNWSFLSKIGTVTQGTLMLSWML